MTAPVIASARVDWSALQPACEGKGCDRPAMWLLTAHRCSVGGFHTAFACDPCLTGAREDIEPNLPLTCQCDIRWTSWRQVCPRQVRL